MSVRDIIQSATGSAGTQTYVDDVFSTYLYTGNGSTQTITNGIDLAGKGGLVWVKGRTTSYVHTLYSTDIGANKYMSTTSTGGFYDQSPYGLSFNSNGFSVTDEPTGIYGVNGSTAAYGGTYASWTFRKAAKFFDTTTVVHTTGASSNVPLPTNYADVGFSIVKNTSTTGDWYAFHRSLGQWDGMQLNSTAAASGLITEMVCFTPGNIGIPASAPSGTYVGYFFYHNTAADGMIQCGSYTGNGNAITGPVINLGWEPQWVMLKNATTGALYYDWYIMDAARGIGTNTDQTGGGNLNANTTDAQELSFTPIQVTPTGFKVITTDVVANKLGDTFIYMAIRRPNKPPTSGTQVFNSVPRTGTGANLWVASGAGFPPDMTIMGDRSGQLGVSYAHAVIDRVRRATEHIQFSNASAEGGGWGYGHIHNMNGYDGLYSGDAGYYNMSAKLYVDYHFKRAPGFFDVVCYTGTGAARTITHNLTVAPELVIFKCRSSVVDWIAHCVYTPTYGIGYFFNLNTTAAQNASTWLTDNSQFTSTGINFQNGTFYVNGSGDTYVAYLFATLAGISKVGSYTGNGSSQNIECGFAAGARFVLIKRTDATGDWYTWDTARGIITGNDPHLSLNSSAAEVTADDSIDPYSPGFTVNQVAATDINVTSATYIYLAIA